MARQKSIPSYRLHRQSGQAIVTLVDSTGRRKDVLLGRHGSSESRAEYLRVLAEWEALGRNFPVLPGSAPTDISVNELILRFWSHVQAHYRHPDGSPTSEVENFRYSLRPVREAYGHTPAQRFGPLALKAVRQKMVHAGLARRVINQRVGRVKRMFKWAASEELVPAAVHHGLSSVAGLAQGRSSAADRPPVLPVPDADVEAVLPFLTRHVGAMVRIQRLTGMRPGEACRLRMTEVDATGPIWRYSPTQHKTAWRGKGRVVGIGPRAQAVLQDFLTADPTDFLFSPRRAMVEFRTAQRAARQTKLTPAQRWRKKTDPVRQPGVRYTARSYAKAVAKACARAGVPPWHPNQLRHSFATDVRRTHGLEAAQVGLGHSRADVTQVYAERDMTLAERIASDVG